MTKYKPFRIDVCRAVITGTPADDLSPDEKRWCCVALMDDGVLHETIADMVGVTRQYVGTVKRTVSRADIERIENVGEARFEAAAEGWEKRLEVVQRLAADVREIDPRDVQREIAAFPPHVVDSLLFAALVLVPDQSVVPVDEMVRWCTDLADRRAA